MLLAKVKQRCGAQRCRTDGSARRRAPLAAEGASWAAGCAEKQRPGGWVPVAHTAAGLSGKKILCGYDAFQAEMEGSGTHLRRAREPPGCKSSWTPGWRWRLGIRALQPGHSAPPWPDVLWYPLNVLLRVFDSNNCNDLSDFQMTCPWQSGYIRYIIKRSACQRPLCATLCCGVIP